MGFISNLVKSQSPSQTKSVNSGDLGRAAWRATFGSLGTDKETPRPVSDPTSGYGRSTIAHNDASFKRLLQAMRSKAPGGWSDDRWEQTKHYVNIAYVAIHRQNEQLSQAEFKVYQKDPSHPDGKVAVDNGHDLVRLLERPNPDDCFGDLMSQWNLQLDLTGSALTWIVPNRLGVPFEMYPIPTAIAVPQPAINPDFPDGYYRIQPVYPYGPFSSYPTPMSAVGATIPSEWMMKVKYPHPLLRYEGYSPLTAMRLHLDEIESMDRARWYSMKRAVNPSAVLNFDEVEGSQPLQDDEIERIKAEFENEQQGPENMGKLFVAAPGSKLEQWGYRPADMEYQAGWEQLVSFALGGLGITKPAAGMIEDSSYSTLFATLKQLYWLTLEPKANRIARKLTRYLAPHFGDNLIIEITCRKIDDHDIAFNKAGVLMQAFAGTKNEVRKLLDMVTRLPRSALTNRKG